MEHGKLREKALLMMAVAWVIARRVEPDLTFEEVCTYKLEVVGEPLDDQKAKDRATAIVSVAQLAGISPDEAKKMTVSEIEALTELRRKRTVSRTRPHRRRAS